jgi:tripartite-type tricarboxylate transporter receptor subunit TctC
LSHAQPAPGGYPARQVRIIVPYPPGGPTDVIARLISQKLTEALGQSFFVENLPGAGGAIGAGTAAKAPGDGHTLVVVTNDFAVGSVTSKLPYDPVKNFTPVSIVSASPQVVIAHPSVPAKSLKELVDLAKKDPGKLNYGGMSIGFGQLTSERFFRLGLKIELTRVPFQGAAPLINSTVGGHTNFGFIGLPPAAPLIKDGKLRALAVQGSARWPALPDVPTLREAGISEFPGNAWAGVMAPPKTPRPIVDKLNATVNEILRSPEAKASLDRLNVLLRPSTPEQFAAFAQQQIPIWGEMVRASGATAH